MNIKRTVMGLLTAVALLGTQASAGQIEVYEQEGSPPILHYFGSVTSATSRTPGDAEMLESYINWYQPQKVIMTSSGGSSREGYLIASVLQQAQVTVEVPKGYMCMSACAVGFLGGGTKIIEGVLGFHVMYIAGEVPEHYAATAGQQTGLQDAYASLETGYNLMLFNMTAYLTSPSDFLVFTSEEELEHFKVTDPYKFVYSYINTPDFFEEMDDEDVYKWFLDRVLPPKELQKLVERQRIEVSLASSGEADRPEFSERDDE